MIAPRLVTTLLLGLSAACGGFPSHDQGERGRLGEAGDGFAGATTAHADGAREGLKVATWNLEWLHRRSGTGPVKRSDADYARLRRYAERLDADVIAFQEVDGEEAAERVFDTSRYQLHVAAQSNPQRTGFAIRRGLAVTLHPDYVALDVGQVRVGTDITVEHPSGPLRMLGVHLKSACFADPLDSEKRDCKKLAAQLPVLEAWIDARAAEGVAALVLGDFNRRFFAQPDEPFWRELDDGEPALSDLWAPTEGRRSVCWGNAYPDFIDHIVLNKSAAALALPDSFVQQRYDASDSAYKHVLSDHCPLAITLAESAAQRSDAMAKAAPADEAESEEAIELRIKGNIGEKRRKIYHAPSCPDYPRVKIDESKGERWFATEADAQAAGFRRSDNCH